MRGKRASCRTWLWLPRSTSNLCVYLFKVTTEGYEISVGEGLVHEGQVLVPSLPSIRGVHELIRGKIERLL